MSQKLLPFPGTLEKFRSFWRFSAIPPCALPPDDGKIEDTFLFVSLRGAASLDLGDGGGEDGLGLDDALDLLGALVGDTGGGVGLAVLALGDLPVEKFTNLGEVALLLNSTKAGEVTYVVEKGDVWSVIAQDNNMTNSDLLALNPGYDIE